MRGNAGQHGKKFKGMTVRIGKRFYTIISEKGKTYDECFTLKDTETGNIIKCGRDKFIVPRKLVK